MPAHAQDLNSELCTFRGGMRTLTMRALFERDSVLRILEEPEFERLGTGSFLRENHPPTDHFLAVVVFGAEPQGDGTLLLSTLSTTLLAIQQNTISRLRSQGVLMVAKNRPIELLAEALRAHFRADHENLRKRLESISVVGPGIPMNWIEQHFSSGAGDSIQPITFITTDPELEELEKLWNKDDDEQL